MVFDYENLLLAPEKKIPSKDLNFMQIFRSFYIEIWKIDCYSIILNELSINSQMSFAQRLWLSLISLLLLFLVKTLLNCMIDVFMMLFIRQCRKKKLTEALWTLQFDIIARDSNLNTYIWISFLWEISCIYH